MNTKAYLVLVAAAVTTGAIGCGGESSNSGELNAWAAIEGIYRIDAMTRNEMACDVEGASTLTDTGDHVAVFSGSDFGGAWIKALGCPDPAACRTRVADVRAQRPVSFAFSYEFRTASDEKLEGQWVTTGFSGQAQCTDASLTNITLTKPADGRIRVEARSVVVDHPPDAQGICWTDDTKSAAAGKPCNELEVVAATWVEAL